MRSVTSSNQCSDCNNAVQPQQAQSINMESSRDVEDGAQGRETLSSRYEDVEDKIPDTIYFSERPVVPPMDFHDLPQAREQFEKNQAQKYLNWALVAAITARLAWFGGQSLIRTFRKRKPKTPSDA